MNELFTMNKGCCCSSWKDGRKLAKYMELNSLAYTSFAQPKLFLTEMQPKFLIYCFGRSVHLLSKASFNKVKLILGFRKLMKNKFYENFVDKVTNAHYVIFKVNEIFDITAPFSQLI